MANILDILTRAQALRQETALNSITPDRAGGIMYDTLILINQMQLEGGSLLISKVYSSVAAMEADTTPTSDLTGRALRPGQLAVIVPSSSTSSDMGSVYRYNEPGSWTLCGKIGGLPMDTVPIQGSSNGITSGAVYNALSALKNEGYKYMGVATPGSGGTAPGTPNQPVFYVAAAGSYPNFGNLTVASGHLGFLKYSNGSWTVESIEVGKDYDEEISQLQHKIGEKKTFPTLLETYPYPINDGSYVSSFEIPAGALIKKVTFDATSAGSGTRGIYLIRKTDNVCVYQKIIVVKQGTNEVEIGYTTDDICHIGVKSLNLSYSSGGSIPDSSVFSVKLLTASPTFPSVGTAITISENYSGKFALSFNVEWTTGLKTDIVKDEEDIEKLQEDVSNLEQEVEDAVGTYSEFPKILDSYQYDLSELSYVGDNIIPSGSIIKEIRFVASSDSGGNNGVVYVIRNSDNVCVYRKESPFILGENTVQIGYTTEDACRVGVYFGHLKYSNGSGIADDSVWSIGLRVATPSNPSVGTAVTIADNYSGKFAISVSVVYGSGTKLEIEEIKGDIKEIQDEITRGRIYPHGAIVSFIDDDTGKYVPTIWGEILQASPIRMGFACITGYMAGLETPPEIYEPMPLADLMALYNAGHEIYSHSYSHPAFYGQSLTLENIAEQCYKSKDWLLSQGLFRGNDVIVYPGGMGENLTDRQAVVRQFYAWGVDTVGGGINPEPIKPWTVYRINADTATLDELKDAVDNAVSGNKLLVFMNHAYELNRDKDAQVAKMVAIIDYIKGTTAEITPLNEALHKIYGWWPI